MGKGGESKKKNEKRRLRPQEVVQTSHTTPRNVAGHTQRVPQPLQDSSGIPPGALCGAPGIPPGALHCDLGPKIRARDHPKRRKFGTDEDPDPVSPEPILASTWTAWRAAKFYVGHGHLGAV